jgi:signal transduction histidine kinase
MTDHTTPKDIIPRAFPGISQRDVEDLIVNSQTHIYPPETILCYEGAHEDTFYIILEGQVQVTKVINNAQIRLLNYLGPGDFFGEMAIIHNAPRGATVKTVEKTTVIEIQRQVFDKILQTSTSFAVAMTREISRRLRENDQMAVEDLKQRANELALAYQQLAEQEFARRQFLTTIAHELRTPLTVANGFLQMIQQTRYSTETLPSLIDSIAKNIQQIVTLTNDILFLQEMDLILPKFQPVELENILDHVIESFKQKSFDKNIQIIKEYKPDIPEIMGDSQSLERAIGAIVDNAIKYSLDGGKVIVRLSNDNNRIQVEIQDHGVGISPDALPKIFDRFFHIENINGQLFGGVGLGLSIAHQVIEQHGGDIEVSSTPGSGSTFFINMKPYQEITTLK